jgi:hypothetical protein
MPEGRLLSRPSMKRYPPEDPLPLRSDTHESILPPPLFFFRTANTIFFPLPWR